MCAYSNPTVQVLAAHVVPGAVRVADLYDGQVLPTLADEPLTVAIDEVTRIVSIAAATGGSVARLAPFGDFEACSAIVHVVDTVLIPGDGTDEESFAADEAIISDKILRVLHSAPSTAGDEVGAGYYGAGEEAGDYGFVLPPTTINSIQQEAARIEDLEPAAPSPADRERSLMAASVAVAISVLAGLAMLAGLGAVAVMRRRRSAARAPAAGVADMV